MDVVHCRALEPHRARHLTALTGETRAWLKGLGFAVTDESLWTEALTHGSTGEERKYDRLEFLGDRVLGLSISEWLFRNNPAAAEGDLAQRLNALVSRQVCAETARRIGMPDHVRLGKQARDDGAADSDNVLGDVMEALLGTSFLEAGFDPTRDIVHRLWQPAIEGHAGRRKHRT